MAKAVQEKKVEPITWTPVWTEIATLRENPNNPKIMNEIGAKRLKKSLKKFGLADTLVANLNNNDIINGHSRKKELEEDGVTHAWVSFPSRELTQKEYDEMNAIYDEARAGSIDMFIVGNILEEEVINEWDLLVGEGKRPKVKKNENGEPVPEAKYPLVAQYDEKYEAIVIVCTNSIDTIFIKNCLNVSKMMSYKNKAVKETSIITAKHFIKQWNEGHNIKPEKKQENGSQDSNPN